MRQLNKLEQKIKQHLLDGPTTRKYELWQRVKDGQIVGFYYQSVAVYCKADIRYLGWIYVVENNNGYVNEQTEDEVSLPD